MVPSITLLALFWFKKRNKTNNEKRKSQRNSDDNPELQLIAKPYAESAWVAYLKEQKLAFGGTAFEHAPINPFVSHSVLGYIGGLDELIAWASKEYNVPDYRFVRFHISLHHSSVFEETFARF